MPFDGSGNFSRIHNWQSDRDNGIRILASRMDEECNNLAAGLNVVFFRNGLVPMSGNLNMGQNYISGVGAGSVGALSLRFGDDPNTGFFLDGYSRFAVVANGGKRLVATGTGIDITGTLGVTGASTFTGNASVIGTLNSSGTLSQGGNAVWHAANFTPGNYALLSGANFTGALQQAGNQVWHAGNFTPANYMPLSGGTFTGNVAIANTKSLRTPGIFFDNFTTSFKSGIDWYGAANNCFVEYMAAAGMLLRGPSATLTAPTGSIVNSYALRSVVEHAGGYGWTWERNTLGGIAPTIVAELGANGNLRVLGDVQADGALRQGANAVWHAGNLNPSIYAPIANPVFTGGVTVGVLTGATATPTKLAIDNTYGPAGSNSTLKLQLFGNGGETYGFGVNSAAQVEYHAGPTGGSTTGGHAHYINNVLMSTLSRTGLTVAGTFNSTGAITQNGSAVWHAGNFTPGNYALIASPAFTGTPTAPTAAFGNSTAQIATTAFVANAVSGGTGGYAPLASPAFTGTPTAPTAAAGTNTTQLATTAYVANYAPLSGANFTGALQQGGNAVWHAGNFAPANYAPLASPTFTGSPVIPVHLVNRSVSADRGIQWWNTTYNAWAEYMGPGGTGAQGPKANMTLPVGAAVTSWALRSLVENVGGYGWVWESGGIATTAPTIMAELSASTGEFRTTGPIYTGGNLVYHAGNLNPANYMPLTGGTFSGDILRSGSGRYFHDGMSRASTRITDGTAAPSGGTDGDIYFQYV